MQVVRQRKTALQSEALCLWGSEASHKPLWGPGKGSGFLCSSDSGVSSRCHSVPMTTTFTPALGPAASHLDLPWTAAAEPFWMVQWALGHSFLLDAISGSTLTSTHWLPRALGPQSSSCCPEGEVEKLHRGLQTLQLDLLLAFLLKSHFFCCRM